jgi:TRAP transporter TAXI family solute receptor
LVRDRIRVLTPLYTEEVHILVKKKVKNILDLKGKKVCIGSEGSGTRETAKAILKVLNFSEKNIFMDNSSIETALAKLKKNDSDAVFLVAGAPVKILYHFNKSEKSLFHLLNISEKNSNLLIKSSSAYKKRVLKKNTYPWLDKNVNILSVDSALIVRKDLPDDIVEKILLRIFENQVELFLSHQKWSELDLGVLSKYIGTNKYDFHPGVKKGLIKLKK